MIVYTRDDVLRLSGAMLKNQWLTIKAAANLLLRDHPQGIIIDCTELGHVSEDGAFTFLDAIKDITAAGARIMVANLPEAVMPVLRSVPGVRSQLPIASSLEEARDSLKLGGARPISRSDRSLGDQPVLIPMIEGFDTEYSLTVASRIAHETHQRISMVYFLEVARNLPIGAPLPEEEAIANRQLEDTTKMAQRMNVSINWHVERTRHLEEGLLHALTQYNVSHVVISAQEDRVGEEQFLAIVELLLHRAPCNVIIGRRAREKVQG